MFLRMRKIILFLLFIACVTFTHAQSRNGLYKFSLPGKSSIVLSGIGPSYLFGDVGGNKDTKGLFAKTDFVVAQTKYMFSVNYRYVFQNNIGFKTSALFGKFEGTDVGSRNAARGFNFSTNLSVFALHIEYNLIGGENAEYSTPHKVYVFGGVGALISKVDFNSPNPLRNTASLRDKHAPNAVLTIVGNGYNAKMTSASPAFPVGAGYEYELSPNFSIGAEYVIHASFSDYIDGVTTSDSKNKDYLMNLDLTLTYKFGTSRANRSRVNWN
jgi:opacity protein-like surface antigen